MANYKRMYLKLFNNISNAITLLQTAQAETEEKYISQEDPAITVLDNPDK